MRIGKPDPLTTIATQRRSWWRGGGFNVVRSTEASGSQVIAWFYQEKDADLFVSWFDMRIAQ